MKRRLQVKRWLLGRQRVAAALEVLAVLLAYGCSAWAPRSPEQVQTDAATAAGVYAAIKANPLYLYPALDVSVNRGVVYLSGLASSPAGFDEATAVARRVPGVTAVANAMELTSGRL
jgi:osmotically-inducible protein OsmY